MFSRRERLPRAIFSSALKAGRRLSSPHFSVVIPAGVRGYAVVVSKKVARLSVTRHQIKRRVLAALRTFPLPPALIIFPRASAGSVSYGNVQAELKKLLS